MIRSLIGLPLHVAARVTRTAVRGTADVAGYAFGVVGLVSDAVSGPRQPAVDLDGSPHDSAARRSDAGSRSGPAPRARPPSPRTATATGSSAPATAQPSPRPGIPDVDSPEHVSAEPTLVDSVAEAGAEDGAGAQVNVAEPWEGYRQMKADDVIDRLSGSSTAVLAAVELYERSGRGRESILAAVAREFKRAGG